ncbi:alpha/beta-hydrolase [Macrolepiota fuliginosa MF-IS2]|uniref:Alpha/beta-hydrolase n=1 Tax=Macrolepiota fuliginosa MF-IS2 TaxID=1400762 RepID=A0A9P5XK31_9AGAR|nr:alpha/beta-hydrolase [Macrolepiota fuliginosa MF-IS2]
MAQLEQFSIAGLNVNVFTLNPLSTSDRPVIALFFLHGRHGSASQVQQYAEVILEHSRNSDNVHELMIITLDHRNHGSRLRNPKSNDSWNKDPIANNERHALDMYAIQTGTASDVSYLIDFLPAFLFPTGNRSIRAWGVAGKSLGGHSTWIILGQDDRVSFGVPIIACPDYLKLMRGRAKKRSIPYAPPYFPASLVALINKRDPVTKAFDRLDDANPFLGKKILVLSGGADKLVPWEASRSFVEALEVGSNGVKKVIVQEGIGHECTKEMLEALSTFIAEEYLRK